MGDIFKNLDDVIQKIEAGALRGTSLGGKDIQGKAKELVPVAKHYGGALINSIQEKTVTEKGQIKSTVFTNLEYAPYVEFGTGKRGDASPSPPKSPDPISYRYDWAGMKAQPYLYPAMIEKKARVKEIIVKAIKETLGEGL